MPRDFVKIPLQDCCWVEFACWPCLLCTVEHLIFLEPIYFTCIGLDKSLFQIGVSSQTFRNWYIPSSFLVSSISIWFGKGEVKVKLLFYRTLYHNLLAQYSNFQFFFELNEIASHWNSKHHIHRNIPRTPGKRFYLPQSQGFINCHPYLYQRLFRLYFNLYCYKIWHLQSQRDSKLDAPKDIAFHSGYPKTFTENWVSTLLCKLF